MKLDRLRTATIGLLSVLLLVSGSTRETEVVQGPEAVAPRVDAGAVSRVVARVNPSLSAVEADRIGAAVLRYGAKYGLDPELVMAVLVVESGARPWALSPKGALGLMQVMPNMLAPLALAGNSTSIESNVEAGCRILAENIRRLGEDDGISAYFWGSEIRSVAYLDRVRAARARVRRLLHS